MKKQAYLFFIGALALAFIGEAYAQAPRRTGTYKAWRSYVIGTSENKVCYIVSEPIAQKPKGVRRGDVVLLVTHRQEQNIRNELSLRVGYVFSPKSRPFAKIGESNFQFFTGIGRGKESAHWAWLENPQTADDMIPAMREGNRLVFKGTSNRGTRTEDTYSLAGFTAASKQMDEDCPL